MSGTAVDSGSPHIRNLHLFTKKSACVQALESVRPDFVDLNSHIMESLPELPQYGEPTLLLLDCASLSWTESLALLEKAQPQDPVCSVALINVSIKQDIRRALKWPVLHGIFTEDQDDSLLSKGLNELLAGRFWFSRDQMNLMAAFREKPRQPSSKPAEALSPREMEVLDLTAKGKSNADIARELFLSEHTVKTHLYNLFRKLGVANRTQAVHWYQENR